MALGISERMIQRAFGAQDLSPIYNTLSAANQRIAAEDRARKVEAEKRYYTELADINKQKVGAREADIPDITKDYNQWSAIEKQLSSNPSLITRNPEQYGKLKSESNTLYSKMLTNIQGSKEFAQYEKDTYRKIVDPNNIDDWDDSAQKNFKEFVLSKPLSLIRQDGLDDMSIYRSKYVDGSNFYKSLPGAFALISKYEPDIVDEASKPVNFVTKVFQYKNLIPSVDVARNAVLLQLDSAGISDSQMPKFAKQEFDKIKDYDNTIIEFNKIYNDNQKKFKLPPLPEGMFDESLPPKAKLIDYLAAKQFILNYTNPTFKTEDKFDKVAFADSQRAKSEAAAIRREDRAFDRLDKAIGAGPVKISPLFEQASKGGEIGVSAMRETSNQFNSIGAADKMFPFTALEVHRNKEGYDIGSELASKDADRIISKKFSVKNPNTEQGKQQLNELSAAINEANKSRGFLDSDITPEALKSGRVMILRTTDAAKNPINIYLNVNGKKSRSYTDAYIAPPQRSAKETRQNIGAMIMPSVTGTAEEYGL